MARFGNNSDDRLQLSEATGPQGQFQYLAFPLERVALASDGRVDASARHVLIERSLADGTVTISPLNTLEGSERFFQPKYAQLARISFEYSGDGEVSDPFEEADSPALYGPDTFDVYDFLDLMPAGFVKDPQYGLGWLRDCNRLVHLLEEHTGCTEVRFESGSDMKLEGNLFRIGLERWRDIWSEIVRINSRANVAASRIKDSFVNNELADTLGIDHTTPILGRHAMSKLLASAANGEEVLTEEDQRDLMSAMSARARTASEVAPDSVIALQRDLELVNLDRLIEHFEHDIEKQYNEEHWQDFFESNAFALQQVFGSPVVNVVSKASVGGTKLRGSGNKIADYLVKNPLTANVALVEIKTPKTKLVKSNAYRDGVFGISTELSEAVTQVLDQAHQLKLHFANIKMDSQERDLEAYSIGCFVIAGQLPSEDQPDKVKSFELFRGNSRVVSVVTFDEVLASLKLLRDLLNTGAPEPQADSGTRVPE
ncbi:hypothetical protein ALI44B_00725 [Leifsonia sp. ALI-44-B]|uniref:Shedu immune nuclease family protein n=1 Tax=Leifsonia sp. ALI-44-B TaxID=1933776 RepID=UPI00097C0FE7|nr:Shedu immune nuclease family protein [Leifsonia sp. ALI-44-B]ONI65249.1 hypothetical protein ALI44B_00725 [Leifsonia sp. ALI-44-B]